MTNSTSYCDLKEISHTYRHFYHGYLSLVICIIGSIANILNICVLCTKQMRSTTNVILAGLAISDLCVMLDYIPFIVHRSLVPERHYATNYTYRWAIYYKIHSFASLSLHFISCCHNIILAIWRYVFVSRMQGNRICTNHRNTLLVVIATYVLCPLVCLPNFCFMTIEKHFQRVDSTGRIVLDKDAQVNVVYHNASYFTLQSDPNNKLILWIYTILLKLCPCILLSVFSYLIISVLLKTKKRRRKLLNSCCQMEDLVEKSRQESIQLYKENQADRTTIMLLIVLILFLLTEFPQAIMGVISIVSDDFLRTCYAPLGDLLDVIALTNSAINFILYCAMSRQFRTTFQELFHLKKVGPCCSKVEVPHEDNGAETKMSLV